MKKNLLVVFVVMLVGVGSAQNDRVTFGLKGNVKKIVQDSHAASSDVFWEIFDLEFSQNGMLSKIDGKEVKKETDENRVYYTVDFEDDEYSTTLVFSRPPQGRISTYYFDDGGMIGENTVIYDAKGRVDMIKSFAYIEAGYNPETGKDEAGRYEESGLVKFYYDEKDNVIKTVQQYQGSDRKITKTYNYQSFDSLGNWIVRVVNCEAYEIKNQVEKRTIEYY